LTAECVLQRGKHLGERARESRGPLPRLALGVEVGQPLVGGDGQHPGRVERNRIAGEREALWRRRVGDQFLGAHDLFEPVVVGGESAITTSRR
jgi:hypothetical protein